MIADLPVNDISISEPLIPEPPGMTIPPSRAARMAAAQQWAAWWRILWAQNIAHHRESPVQPEPSLLGLDPMYSPDPPKFRSLTPAPELRQIVASSWPALSAWTQRLNDSDDWDSDTWQQGLIARAETRAGRHFPTRPPRGDLGLAQGHRPIAEVEVHLELLPVLDTGCSPKTRIDTSCMPSSHPPWLPI
jgi:hypothetical protein